MQSVATDVMNYAEGFEYAVQQTRWLLMPLGLWTSKSAVYQRFLRPAANVGCMSILMFVIIPFWLLGFAVKLDARLRVKWFMQLSFTSMNLFKYIMMIFKQREVAFCAQNILTDWQKLSTPSERRIMLENARMSRFMATICVTIMFSSGILFTGILPLLKGSMVRHNVTVRSLPYPGYFPFFNPQIRPLYDYVFATQFICALIRCSVTGGVFSFTILCVMHISSQIAITSSKFDRLVDNFDKDLLGEIVNQHLRYLKFASKLEGIINEICLVDVVGSTLFICLLGYYLITEYEQKETFISILTYCMMLLMAVYNIFVLCYVGEILTEQCQSLGTTAYMIHWYYFSGVEARNIVLLIASTQHPVVLTAGKMLNLSMQTFSNIMKASASYINMLRTVIANES